MTRGIAVYRQLIRSANHAFRGDSQMLKAAQLQIRSEFESNKSVPQGNQLNDLLSMGSETAEFIKTSIVQAKVNNKDMKLPRVKK